MHLTLTLFKQQFSNLVRGLKLMTCKNSNVADIGQNMWMCKRRYLWYINDKIFNDAEIRKSYQLDNE